MSLDKKNILDAIRVNQDDFYLGSMNTILTKRLNKVKCTEYITSTIPLDVLISNTLYSIKNTNKIFVNYLLFKTFANVSNYQEIINKIIELIIITKNIYGSYEIHINLDSLSITALERYKNIFQLYYDTCCNIGLHYDDTMKMINIYNTPSIVNSLSLILIKFTDDSIKKKMNFFTRDQSKEILLELLR